MKTTLAATLSLVGVLSAGAAAALVNTSIFDSAPTEATASSAFLPEAETVNLALPTSSEPPTSSPAGETSAESVMRESVATQATGQEDASLGLTPLAESTTTTTTIPASYLTTYNIGEAGTTTVDVADSRILLLDASAAPGWTVVKTEVYPERNAVEVEFTNGSVEVSFEATFDAQLGIVPEISSREIGPSIPSHDDDHDDDDHDDDDDDNDDNDDDDDDDDDDDNDDDDDDDDDDERDDD